MDDRGAAAMRLAATRALLISIVVCDERYRCKKSQESQLEEEDMVIFSIDGARTQLDVEAPRWFDEVLRRRAMLPNRTGTRKCYRLSMYSQGSLETRIMRQGLKSTRDVDSGSSAQPK